MNTRLMLSIAMMAATALSFACGGGTTNVNVAANKMANNTGVVVNSSTNSNITVTPVGNTATNTSPYNAANKPANTASNIKPANSKDTAAANKTTTPPKGATYLCKDGTYSFSKSDSGSCSGHGGVQKPLTDKPGN